MFFAIPLVFYHDFPKKGFHNFSLNAISPCVCVKCLITQHIFIKYTIGDPNKGHTWSFRV